jgi:hypothetical protein
MIFPNIFLFDLLHQSHENHGMFISKNAQNFHIVKPWCHLAARHCLSGLQHPLQLNRTRCSVGLSPGWTARDLWRRWGLSVQLEPCGFPFCGEKGGKTRSRSISQGLEINGTNEKKTPKHIFSEEVVRYPEDVVLQQMTKRLIFSQCLGWMFHHRPQGSKRRNLGRCQGQSTGEPEDFCQIFQNVRLGC